MKILVVGAGMYVTGRGTSGIGTILPALAQFSRHNKVESVTIAATRPEAESGVAEAVQRVNGILGSSLRVTYRELRADSTAMASRGEFDCAVVCVPDDLHFVVTAALLRAGIHCLVVKPFTPTLAEATELVALQRAHGLYGAVEFHKRFDEQNLLVRKLIREGTLGSPRYMVVSYSQRIGIPLDLFRGWSSRTNIFQYLGVHYVDLAYFLTGFRPLRVSAIGSKGLLASCGVDTWDSVHATIVWQGANSSEEFVSQLAIGWIDPESTSAMSDQRFYLVGSRGRVDLDQTDRGVKLVTGEAGVENPNPYFSMVLGDDDGLAFQGYGYKSIERFLKDASGVIRGDVEPEALDQLRSTFDQSLISTAVVDAVNMSLADNGTWRDVDVQA